MTSARRDPWHCAGCGAGADLAPQALEIGLVRLAGRGEEGFRLGSEGVEELVAPLLRPCACGGRLVPGPVRDGDTASADREHMEVQVAAFDEARLRPLLEAGWARLEDAADPRLAELRELWHGRALVLLGREEELSTAERQRLRLEERLEALAREVELARARGDEDAAQLAHARYIEIGTSYVRRFKLADEGGRGGGPPPPRRADGAGRSA